MIKSLTALAIFALLGTAVVALPILAPRAKAEERMALAKGDRLAVHSAIRMCSSQVWPNFDSTCLRKGSTGGAVQQVRSVTPRPDQRLPREQD
jgi:hypothetical protein